MPACSAELVLFTIGYEASTPAELVAKLHAASVDRVIDVRELPLSRRRGFSKTALSAYLATCAIDYVHLRLAGNPYRHAAGNGLASYKRYLSRSPEVLHALRSAMRGHRAALLCVERDASCCHRRIIAERLAVPTTHL